MECNTGVGIDGKIGWKASQLYDDFVDHEHDDEMGAWVNRLASYENDAGRDERLVLSNLHIWIYHALQAAALKCRRNGRQTLDATIAFCIHEGLPLVRSLPGVSEIGQSRDEVLQGGSAEDLICFDSSFLFEIDNYHTGRATRFSRLCAKDKAALGGLQAGLGLSNTTIAALCIMAVLVHMPIADVPKQRMVEQLTAFGHRVKARARQAKEIAAAIDWARPRLRTSFDQIRASLDDEEGR